LQVVVAGRPTNLAPTVQALEALLNSAVRVVTVRLTVTVKMEELALVVAHHATLHLALVVMVASKLL